MAKQTALEWIIQWSKENPIAYQSDYYAAIEQAKQMEKEQIIKAFNEGTFSLDEKINAEQYYNETYNK